MAERERAEPGTPEHGDERNGRANGGGREHPATIDEARHALLETRRRMSRELDGIEARLRRAGGDLRRRMDVLEPARERIRRDVWGSVAIAFGVGLAFGLLTAKRRDGRRGLAGQIVRSGVAQLPGAVFGGVRAGVADRLREEWHTPRPRPALRAPARP